MEDARNDYRAMSQRFSQRYNKTNIIKALPVFILSERDEPTVAVSFRSVTSETAFKVRRSLYSAAGTPVYCCNPLQCCKDLCGPLHMQEATCVARDAPCMETGFCGMGRHCNDTDS